MGSDDALSEHDRVDAMRWWRLAQESVSAERGPAWLSFYLAMTKASEVAGTPATVSPIAYLLPIFAGYALRGFVDQFATPRPLALSTIDPAALPMSARLPWDPETGLLSIENLSDSDAEGLEPIASLTAVTAIDDQRFGEVVSVTPPFWRAVVSIATEEVRRGVEDPGLFREPPRLSTEAAESYLRYGFVLRCVEEALGIAGELSTST